LFSVQFALVFNGRSIIQTHCLGVFAPYPRGNSSIGYEKALLFFSPVVNEEGFSPNAHLEYFKFIQDNYVMSWEILLF
jgi:hypothetical protein